MTTSSDRKFQVDSFITANESLINDEKLKNILQGNTRAENPDDSIFSTQTPAFHSPPNSHFRTIEKRIKTFQFSKDRSEDEKNPYYGPIKILSENSIFIGQLNPALEREGRGIQFLHDGSFYEGYFLADSTSRSGRLIFPDGDVYTGELLNNSLNGYGTYEGIDGRKITGHFQEDKNHGECFEEWPDGSSYRGMYKFGCKEGHGEFRCENGDKYVGNFSDDLWSGEGVFMSAENITYKGCWNEGTLTSPAEMIYPNGNCYKGEIKDMKKNGHGCLEDHGTKFIGDWSNNQMNGVFVIRDQSGRDRKAKYDSGKFVDWVDHVGSSRDVKVNSITPGEADGNGKAGDGDKKTVGCWAKLCGK